MTKICTYLWLLTLICFSHIFNPLSKTREIYPFYTWRLFGPVEKSARIFQINVASINGSRVGPCYLGKCHGREMNAVQKSCTHSAIQDFGREVYYRANHQMSQQYIQHFNHYYFNDLSATYQLVLKSAKLDHDPIKWNPDEEIIKTIHTAD